MKYWKQKINLSKCESENRRRINSSKALAASKNIEKSHQKEMMKAIVWLKHEEKQARREEERRRRTKKEKRKYRRKKKMKTENWSWKAEECQWRRRQAWRNNAAENTRKMSNYRNRRISMVWNEQNMSIMKGMKKKRRKKWKKSKAENPDVISFCS